MPVLQAIKGMSYSGSRARRPRVAGGFLDSVTGREKQLLSDIFS